MCWTAPVQRSLHLANRCDALILFFKLMESLTPGDSSIQHPNSSLSSTQYIKRTLNWLFLIDQKLLPMISQVEYNSIVILDHCPVLLRLQFPENILPKGTWCLNSRLFADKKCVYFINTQIDLSSPSENLYRERILRGAAQLGW